MWTELSTAMKAFAVCLVLAFAVGAGVYAWNGVFAPRFAEQDRKTFEQSAQHRGAVAGDLADRCAELARADNDTARKGLRAVIYQRTNDVNLDDLQLAPDVRECVTTARKDYLNAK